ncbi:putative late blight resistance protein homolog R1C-3 [Salvia hispanica]|uniref:putative late blight resistance protein homolog R1C-3 n=1 Tax=Salvia hispanica TaxID=49212 RepID=UPI0020092136|nr:putative late blight resistance protein homolog R1C-3 [Salvia hispanica]
MAAFGAVASLKNTIKHILQLSRISLVPPSPQILQSAYDAMCSLQEVLLKLEHTGFSKMRTKVNDLDGRIKEVVWEFEDLLDSHVYDQIPPQLESSSISERDQLPFSVDLQILQQNLDCFLEMVAVMEVEYLIELLNMPEEEGEPLCSRIDFGGINSYMVGLSREFERVRRILLVDDEAEGNCCDLVGMAGVGKTTLAKKVFDDPLIQSHFQLRAWVKVGRKCESNELLRCILAQVAPSTRYQMITQEGGDDDEMLVGLLQERLKDKKCLIVLDDVWDRQVMDNLPQENVRFLLTSRFRTEESSTRVVLRLLDKEESKQLLGATLFGENSFPPHLEKLGEEIAYKCEGLPLMIVTVAKFLSEEDKTPQFWAEVAKIQHNSVFLKAYDEISVVLFPSYDYLPQYLKMFFLYLGSFRPYVNVDQYSFFNLLSAEGFVEHYGVQNFNKFMIICSIVLIDRHLILYELDGESQFSKKDFRVHSCWQHLCRKEASKIKFLHVLQSWDDDLKDQRRLGVHCNTLFAFKEVYDSIKSDCASMARSLLCFGPYHPYPVPIHVMDFKLLKVLDALQVRFYNIPLEILKLVYLKYLALTCNAELPISISNLFQLQFLIIVQHMVIKRRGEWSYMPVAIWDMQELQRIQVMGRDLPTPNRDSKLEKLSSLLGVSAKSCTSEILKRTPNLKELQIQMELKPYDEDDDSNTLSGLYYIAEELHNLDSLTCIVVNPDMKYEYVAHLSMFPSSIKILNLSGLGCSLQHMNDIGSLLPNLLILSTKCYAFRGPEWEIESSLLIERLESLYATKSTTNRLHFKNKLLAFKITESKEVLEQLEEFHRLLDDLEEIEETMKDEDKTLMLLHALPRSYVPDYTLRGNQSPMKRCTRHWNSKKWRMWIL